MTRCAECRRPFVASSTNVSNFCSWECADARPRENAPEILLGFLGDGVTMTRVDDDD